MQLFDPITLRGMTARNRLWVAPMCQYSAIAEDGLATDWHLAHYTALARGGAGLVMVEATGVLPQGRISPRCLGLWDQEHAAALEPLVAGAHAAGAAIGIQLNHAGRKASTYPGWGFDRTGTVPAAAGGWPTAGPSDVPFPGYEPPTALTLDGIDGIVEAFGTAARRAKQAGFDTVEIHGAHGYLIHQFLSPLSNTRTDEYGGTLENRARLLLRVAGAIRVAVGENYPVVARLSASDWLEGGLTLDETIQVVTWLAESGVDLVDVSSGGNAPARIPIGPGYQVALADAVRRATGMPTSAVGLVTEAGQAAQIVLSRQADVVSVGRAVLRNPFFPLQVAAQLGVQVDYIPPQYTRAWPVRH